MDRSSSCHLCCCQHHAGSCRPWLLPKDSQLAAPRFTGQCHCSGLAHTGCFVGSPPQEGHQHCRNHFSFPRLGLLMADFELNSINLDLDLVRAHHFQDPGYVSDTNLKSRCTHRVKDLSEGTQTFLADYRNLSSLEIRSFLDC